MRSDAQTITGARLRRAGAAGASPETWALRLGAGALALAVAVALWAMVRPLPTSHVGPPTVVTEIPRDLASRVPLVERERLLAKATGAGNLYAPDRQPWPRAVADASTPEAGTDSQDEPPSAPDSASSSAQPTYAHSASSADGASTIPFDAIPFTESPPVGIQKDLKDLRLRGVYRTEAGPVALIGNARDRNGNSAKPRRVGEIFGEEEWAVVAIDDVGKRVILARAGMNVQLAMYTLNADAARVASPKPATALAPVKPSVIVMTRTPEQLRRELVEAGVSVEEIEELLALAAEDSPPAVAAADEPAPVTEAIPDAPEGFAELLKMMSSNEAPGASEAESRRERRSRRDRTEPPS